MNLLNLIEFNRIVAHLLPVVKGENKKIHAKRRISPRRAAGAAREDLALPLPRPGGGRPVDKKGLKRRNFMV